MDYERRSDCWYKDVCQETVCDSCIRYMEMLHLMESSHIPEIQRKSTQLIPTEVDYDAFCVLADIKEQIVEFINSGRSLYICSNYTGNGKTTWAIKLLLKYFDEIWAGNGFRTRGLFIHVPTLLLRLKDFNNPINNEFRQELLSTDVVIFDDIAVTGISQYDYNNLLMFIDNRILHGKSNIYTSNCTMNKDLQLILGSRLASRIWETSIIVKFVGKDRRNGQLTDIK